MYLDVETVMYTSYNERIGIIKYRFPHRELSNIDFPIESQGGSALRELIIIFKKDSCKQLEISLLLALM